MNGSHTSHSAYRDRLITFMADMCNFEEWYLLPELPALDAERSDLWAWEDQVRRASRFCANHDAASTTLVRYLSTLIAPLVEAHPNLLGSAEDSNASISFSTNLSDLIDDLPAIVEGMILTSYAAELEPLKLNTKLCGYLFKKVVTASGGIPGKSTNERLLKLPTKNKNISPSAAPEAYLGGTPLLGLLQ